MWSSAGNSFVKSYDRLPNMEGETPLYIATQLQRASEKFDMFYGHFSLVIKALKAHEAIPACQKKHT